MSKAIIFVTGNKRKIGEAKLACEPLGLEIQTRSLEIDEIQSSNPSTVSLHKAKAAYGKIAQPLVVTDTFWTVHSLNGFPGAYMKDVQGWFSSEDFIALVKDKSDKSVSFSENITYIDEKTVKTFSKEFLGKIVTTPRGVGNSLENIAEFQGVTLGERREQGGYSHEPDEYVWVDFAKWYLGKC